MSLNKSKWHDFHVLIFWFPVVLFEHKCGRDLFLENVNFDELIVITVKMASDGAVRPCVFKKLYKSDHPNL